MLQNNPELKAKIGQLWDKFWSGGISTALTTIEQITYLLFMKRLDDLEQKRQADADFLKKLYSSGFFGFAVVKKTFLEGCRRAGLFDIITEEKVTP